MLIRDCAGGVVFYGKDIFIIRNEKGEWVLPKGVIRKGEMPIDVALRRVKEEGGISASVLSTAGRTSYEFFSVTRQKPVCNRIIWYIMIAKDRKWKIGEPEKFSEAGFFSIDEAIKKVTYSQDKALINLSYKKYQELKNQDIAS